MARRGGGFRKGRGPKSLIDKVRDIDSHFADEVYSLTEDEIKNRLAHYSQETATLEDAKKGDVDLIRLRSETKVNSETYTVPLKAIKLKTRLILQVLKDRGKELPGSTANKAAAAPTPVSNGTGTVATETGAVAATA